MKNLYSNALAISRYLNLTNKDIPITTLPQVIHMAYQFCIAMLS